MTETAADSIGAGGDTCEKQFQGTSETCWRGSQRKAKAGEKRWGRSSGLWGINEHFEPAFITAMATQVFFRGSLKVLQKKEVLQKKCVKVNSVLRE